MDASMPTSTSPRSTAVHASPPTPPSDPAMAIDPEDKRKFAFDYELKNWAAVEEFKVHSPWTSFAGFKWRLLIFPHGNQTEFDMSVYLECGGPVDIRPNAMLGHATDTEQKLKTPLPTTTPTPTLDPSDRGTLQQRFSSVNPSDAMTDSPCKAENRTSSEYQDTDHESVNPPHPHAPTTEVIDVTMQNTLPDSDRDDYITQGPRPSAKSKEPMPPPLMPLSWSRPARFWLSIKPTSRTPPGGKHTPKETFHRFQDKETDWGFREFCSLANIVRNHMEDENGSLTFHVVIKLEDSPPDSIFSSSTWDSRKSTGFVGFKNQGATCYMNSLLQTLYMLGAFRRAVYNMPLPGDGSDVGGSMMSYALQKVFYELQYSSTTVKTKKLTESFGWDNADAFTQHDVQELNRILCDHLEELLKKTSQPNSISHLFEGKIMNFIECVHVDYKSRREESFYDLSLNVKGCRNIYESFDKYCEVEMMDGDNKYRADGFAELQEARKGVKFIRLPPVLQLHLKRFEYDFHREMMVKINDRFEYAMEIDLSPYVDHSDGNDIYVLHSVLVHVGDVNGGHYYAFIRPMARPVEDVDSKPQETAPASVWYKFDDDSVTAATEDNAVLDNFGSGGERDTSNQSGRHYDDIMTGNVGNDLNGTQTQNNVIYQPARGRNYASRRVSNAYMLQYIRKDQADFILQPAKDSDVPKSLAQKIISEQMEEERRKRDLSEQHLYMSFAVAIDKDLSEYAGVDLIDWTKARILRVKRAMHLIELKQLLQDEGLVANAKCIRLWKCEKRRNDSVRPEELLANGVDDSAILGAGRDYGYQYSNMQYGLSHLSRYPSHGDDLLKVYVEDFLSQFCLYPGRHFSRILGSITSSDEFQHSSKSSALVHDIPFTDSRGNEDAISSVKKNSTCTVDTVPDPAVQENSDSKRYNGVMDKGNVTQFVHPLRSYDLTVPLNGFQLVNGEMILLLKRYVPYPVPRLEWAGHCIMDRNALVRDLIPMLRRSVKMRREQLPATTPLAPDAAIVLYEEWSAEKISELNLDATFKNLEIPVENGKGGDIIVFMEKSQEPAPRLTAAGEERGAISETSGSLHEQLPSTYIPEKPLGGRLLPTPVEYYEYLQLRIKVEFKNRYPPDGAAESEAVGLVLEILRHDSYALVRAILASAIGGNCDPNHIRLFSHDFHRDGPAFDPVRLRDSDEIQRALISPSIGILGPGEYRTLWYEKTEYKISEYQNREEVRVMWRPDGGCKLPPSFGSSHGVSPSFVESSKSVSENESEDGMVDISNSVDDVNQTNFSRAENVGGRMDSRAFSVLVPVGATFEAVATQIKNKVGLDDVTGVRLLEVRNFRVSRFIDLSEPVIRFVSSGYVTSEFGTELRAEPISDDEVADNESVSDLIHVSVSHMAKDIKSRAWRGPSFFGTPIIIRVSRAGESVASIRNRIRRRLGVPTDVFDTWRLAEVTQTKTFYLEDVEYMWSPDRKIQGGVEISALAIEHQGSAPSKKSNSLATRYADKPLKIRG